MAVSYRYDHPHYLVRRTETKVTAATASATSAHFIPTIPIYVTAATLTVITAGTSAANATYAVVAGTNTIGTYTAGTATAGSQNTFSVASATTYPVAALSQVNVVKGNEATGVAALSLEYYAQPQSNVAY